MPTTAEYKATAQLVTDTSDDAIVLANIDTWWTIYAGQVSDYVQFLYLKRHILLYLLGATRKRVDVVLGTDQWKDNQEFTNTLKMLEYADKELKLADPSAGAPELGVTKMKSGLPDSFQEAYDLYSVGVATWLTELER